MPTPTQSANLPFSPFDGQEFVDFRGLKWKFSERDNCWRSAGVASDVPLATTEASGLLSPALKRLLDSLSVRAGGFGIISRPLLSVVPLRRKALFKGTIHKAVENLSGSQITIDAALMTVNAYAGKLIFFTSGVLKTKYYLIFTNSDDTIYVMGKEAAHAKRGDKFEILDATAVNEHGVIQGDIELVSETLDISCVNGNGDLIVSEVGCNVVTVDDPSKPPGLDIKVSQKFLDQFCVQIPGCVGPRGDRGAIGPKGKDGTGDGPKGNKGAPGADAPEAGRPLTGIKINDIDDVYDTAVVALELDAAAGKLHIVKAKIKVPGDDHPAEQVIATAVSRDLQFTDTNFDYEILMPNGDPINVADVEIMHYPQGFTPPSLERVRSNKYEANVIKLSTFVDAVVSHFKFKLEKASTDYDQQIKPFIEQKDGEARKILSELADDVAKCEWDMPIEFCLGISPANCKPEEMKAMPFPLAEALLGPEYSGAVAVPLPEIKVPVTPPPTITPPPTPTPLPPPTTHPREPDDPLPPSPPPTDPYPTTPSIPDIFDRPNRRNRGAITPGAGSASTSSSSTAVSVTDADGGTTIRASTIVLTYVDGAARTDQTTWTAAVTAEYFDMNGNSGSVTIKDSDAAILNDFDRAAFISAQTSSSELDTAVAIELNAPGEIELSLVLEGSHPQGYVILQPYQVFTSRTMSNLPTEVTQVMARSPSGELGVAFTGEVDCPDCPDCGDVNCGDVNCPDCPADVSITGITPASGNVPGGYPMTITGTGFGTITGTVYVGSTLATVTGWTATTITITVPPGVAGPADVTVVTNGGADDTAPNGFEYTINIVEIASITPASGTPAGGTSVTITGTGFGTSPGTVTIGGAPAIITGWGPTSITITTPPGSGDADVIVTNSDGDSDTAPNGFEYILDVEITSVAPTTFVAAVGSALVVGGTGFDPSTGTILIGATNATPWITSWTNTSIGLTVPPGGISPGTYNVTVTNIYANSDVGANSVRAT